MNWNVTYRGKDGKQNSVLIEAASRIALFEELSKRGINTIRVEENDGKAVKKRGASKTSGHLPLIKWIAAGLTVVAAAICVWLIKSPKHDPAPSEEPIRIKSTIVEAKHSVSNQVEEPLEIEKPREPEFVMVDNRKVYRNPTNDVGKVVTNAFGKALVIERVVSPSGPMKDGQSLVPRRIFTYDSEVAIDCLMNMDIGERTLMMLPQDMDQDFQNSMAAKIVIEPDDTEDEIRRKNEMVAIKKELAERVANGEKVSQIAAETLAHYNKIATLRDNLQQEIFEMEKNGATPDEIEDVYEAANIMLQEYDALPLHSPKVRKAIIRERLERNKARRQQNGN